MIPPPLQPVQFSGENTYRLKIEQAGRKGAVRTRDADRMHGQVLRAAQQNLRQFFDQARPLVDQQYGVQSRLTIEGDAVTLAVWEPGRIPGTKKWDTDYTAAAEAHWWDVLKTFLARGRQATDLSLGRDPFRLGEVEGLLGDIIGDPQTGERGRSGRRGQHDDIYQRFFSPPTQEEQRANRLAAEESARRRLQPPRRELDQGTRQGIDQALASLTAGERQQLAGLLRGNKSDREKARIIQQFMQGRGRSGQGQLPDNHGVIGRSSRRALPLDHDQDQPRLLARSSGATAQQRSVWRMSPAYPEYPPIWQESCPDQKREWDHLRYRGEADDWADLAYWERTGNRKNAQRMLDYIVAQKAPAANRWVLEARRDYWQGFGLELDEQDRSGLCRETYDGRPPRPPRSGQVVTDSSARWDTGSPSSHSGRGRGLPALPAPGSSHDRADAAGGVAPDWKGKITAAYRQVPPQQREEFLRQVQAAAPGHLKLAVEALIRTLRAMD